MFFSASETGSVIKPDGNMKKTVQICDQNISLQGNLRGNVYAPTNRKVSQTMSKFTMENDVKVLAWPIQIPGTGTEDKKLSGLRNLEIKRGRSQNPC